MYESIITNESSYGYIINDISYQCCAYSYTFERNLKQACSIFGDTYTRFLELEHTCSIFETYILGPWK